MCRHNIWKRITVRSSTKEEALNHGRTKEKRKPKMKGRKPILLRSKRRRRRNIVLIVREMDM